MNWRKIFLSAMAVSMLVLTAIGVYADETDFAPFTANSQEQ